LAVLIHAKTCGLSFHLALFSDQNFTSRVCALLASDTPGKRHSIVKDRSLRSDRYVELGLPADDRSWSGIDMASAAVALQKLADRHPEQLPRYKSTQSASIFARMTSSENLDLYRNKTLPLDSRFPDCLQYVDSLNTINKLYLSAALKRTVTGDELVELNGAILRAFQVELELVEEFLPTLSKQDPKYAVRLDGLKKLQNNLAGIAAGALTMLNADDEDDGALPDWRTRFLIHCHDTLPAIVRMLSAVSQKEVVVRLDKSTHEPKLRNWWPELRQLRDDVRRATEKPGLNL